MGGDIRIDQTRGPRFLPRSAIVRWIMTGLTLHLPFPGSSPATRQVSSEEFAASVRPPPQWPLRSSSERTRYHDLQFKASGFRSVCTIITHQGRQAAGRYRTLERPGRYHPIYGEPAWRSGRRHHGKISKAQETSRDPSNRKADILLVVFPPKKITILPEGSASTNSVHKLPGLGCHRARLPILLAARCHGWLPQGLPVPTMHLY